MNSFKIGNHFISQNSKPYIIGELSANHSGSLNQAKEVMHAISEAGADAVKLQTYTPDTLTIKCNEKPFIVGNNSIWRNRTLYDLYKEAHTPWEWHEELFSLASNLKINCFSTPFDNTSVDFLEKFDPPAYKIASFEMHDLPLIKYVASKNRPIIMSTGMATLTEISESVDTIKNNKNSLALLKCTSAYPSPPEEMNLKTIPHLHETFKLPIGLSDHTLGITTPIAAVSLGACIIEKHVTIDRKISGPDSKFSLEPHEFKQMIASVNEAYASLGIIDYGISKSEKTNQCFRRSLFITKDINKGDTFTQSNVKSIRPGYGLAPKYLNTVIGKKSSGTFVKGTPFNWDMLA